MSLKLVPFIVTMALSQTDFFARYLASKSGVTLKTGLRLVQSHWRWHHLINLIRVPIPLP